jgi:undecaprenyl-diphosphatase
MNKFNQNLFQYLYKWSGKNPLIDGVGIFFANDLIYLLVALFLIFVLAEEGIRRKMYLFIEGALAVILSRGIITETVHFFYDVARPFAFYGFSPLIGESGSSFPSGHATVLFALVVPMWCVNRTWGAFFFATSLLVGIARVYAGIHWPLDILGGIVIGILSGIIVHMLLKSSRDKIYPAGLSNR